MTVCAYSNPTTKKDVFPVKTLIAAVMLLASTSFSHAETCTGRVRIDVETVGDGLYLKGDKVLSVGDCVFEQHEKRVLRTCPLGSRCRVEGHPGGDSTIKTIISVTRVDR